jgi:putative restriction endonuclease
VNARGQQLAIRLAAFEHLAELNERSDGVLDRADLLRGFAFQDQRIPFLSHQQGIWKPRQLDLPLSIMTSPDGPYDDGAGPDGLLRYRYRGTNPDHRDNRGLREAMQARVPLIYFFKAVPSKYVATWPAYIVGDNPGTLTFSVEVDLPDTLSRSEMEQNRLELREEASARRRYVTRQVRQRIHQSAFRERVLRAYQNQCSLCRLRHSALLDAAHIVPDTEPMGEPTVRNGLALCKIHHAAYDKMFIGIRPDQIVVIRRDVLAESDGPMLQHGLKEMHGLKIHVPRSARDRPADEFLEWRYDRFLEKQEGV